MSLGLFPPSWGRVLRNTEMLESKQISSHTVELLLPADPRDAKYKVRIPARPQGELDRPCKQHLKARLPGTQLRCKARHLHLPGPPSSELRRDSGFQISVLYFLPPPSFPSSAASPPPLPLQEQGLLSVTESVSFGSVVNSRRSSSQDTGASQPLFLSISGSPQLMPTVGWMAWACCMPICTFWVGEDKWGHTGRRVTLQLCRVDTANISATCPSFCKTLPLGSPGTRLHGCTCSGAWAS